MHAFNPKSAPVQMSMDGLISAARARARRQGKMFDYFSVSIYETQEELLAHAFINHENAVRLARTARNQIRHGHRNAHRNHELACEDRAHAHSILARAEQLPCESEAERQNLRDLKSICKRTLAIKL